MPPEDPLLSRFVELLATDYACHTVILYGSRARGDATDQSDYDLLGIRAHGDDCRDARWIDGFFLDAFIKNEKSIQEGPNAFLHVRGGIVLRDPHGMGARLLADVAKTLQSPPPEIAANEIETRKSWCHKMMARISRAAPDDVEAHYRRHWLLVDLLELYFVLRRRHYLGSKESFLWLDRNAPSAFKTFRAAMLPGAPVDHIAELVRVVLDH